MVHHYRMAKEGREAYFSCRMLEALLMFRRAASAALDIGDREAWFSHMSWAANAAYHQGDSRSAMALLLEARDAEPERAPQPQAWWCRAQIYLCMLQVRPERSRLEQLLTDLRIYAGTHAAPASDLPYLEGALLELGGDWRQAVARFEAAFQLHDGSGYNKRYLAYHGAVCCLWLGQLGACGDWIAALDRCNPNAPFLSSEVSLLMAIREGRPRVVLRSQLRTHCDLTAGVQRARIPDMIRELTARVNLLDSDAGDPGISPHPARIELSYPIKDRQNVVSRYRSHLLYADYRLACLRHVVGIPAVDDLFYAQAQQLPPCRSQIDISRLGPFLNRARAAAQGALRCAHRLDALLVCDHRRREVESRIRRIEDIARAIAPDSAESL
jgi:tetratricopeptide (TPR) repeat protein